MDQARTRELFLALWRRALQLPILTDLNPTNVREWAEQKGLIVRDVVERDVGHCAVSRRPHLASRVHEDEQLGAAAILVILVRSPRR